MILVFASPALKRWANEFRRYAADTGTLYAGTLSVANLYAANLYATNFRLRIELQTQDTSLRQRLSHEFVSEPRNSENQSRMLGVALDFLAQADNVYIYRTRECLGTIPPDFS
jgi:hypothetical protein